MRRKPLPPPPADRSTIREAQAAVPLVPGAAEDCCDRLRDRLGLPGRDTAATWLEVLEGLELATEGTRGYARVRDDPGDAVLAERFRETWYGAEEVLAVLAEADGSVGVTEVADRTESLATPWERQRHGPDWRDVWRARTADLLGWLAVFGFAERTDDGYQLTD